MEFRYPRLYFRMAVYIGATLIAFILVSAASLILIASYELADYVETRESALGRDAADVLAAGGRPALERWLQDEADVPKDVSIFILNQNSEDILGRPLPAGYANFVRDSVVGRNVEPDSNYQPLRLAPQIIGPNGEVFSFLVLPKSIHVWGSRATYLGVIIVALIVVGSVAWLIAAALGRPIAELQVAVRQLASGQTDARVPMAIVNRHDELGDLAADFNTMADRLQRLINNREQLMQEMSHELRSPLARLQASLALAAHRSSFDDAEKDRIEEEVQRIDQTIGEMLQFSRLEAPATMKNKLLRVDKLLADLVRVEEIEATAQGCTLALKCEHNLTVVGDPDVLRSGFENILRNAIRYAPDSGRIDLAAQRAGKEIVVRISDRGPGVPMQQLDRIFEPFVRVGGGENPSGTGLGLAIARRVFEVHGGGITAANREGGGMIFTITVRAAELT